MAKETISKELLEILCCPTDKGSLKHNKEKQSLVCMVCKNVYPVKSSIPILLPQDMQK